MIAARPKSSPSPAPGKILSSIFALAVLAAPALAGLGLQARIDAAAARIPLGRASIGVCVVDVRTGEVLAGIDADRALIPASNMKLLTSGAALLALGEDFTFRTEIHHQRTADQDRLLVIGSGDPALGDPVLLDQGTPAMDINALLDRIGAAVARRGVRSVDEIVLDDRVFDDQLAHPSWPADQLNRWYCAEVSGLNLHTNVITVYAQARAEAPPLVTLEPAAPWVEFESRATSIVRGQPTAWVARPRPKNAFTLHGKVRSNSAVRVAIHDPTDFAGRVIRNTLAGAGVRAGTATLRRAESDEEFTQTTPLVAITTTLTDILRRCNTDSHNLYAEAMLKRVGHEVTGEPGSWLNGGAVLRMLIAERIGSDHATHVEIADGSGLSRENRVRPDTMALWTASIAREPEVVDAFLASLPRPGEGTLRSRFQESELTHELRAKSGYLRGVYSLSGLLVDPVSGEPEVAFSIFLNDVPEGSTARRAKPFHEAIVTQIDAWLAERPAPVPSMGG